MTWKKKIKSQAIYSNDGLYFGPAMSLHFHYTIVFKSVLVNPFPDVFLQSSNKGFVTTLIKTYLITENLPTWKTYFLMDKKA